MQVGLPAVSGMRSGGQAGQAGCHAASTARRKGGGTMKTDAQLQDDVVQELRWDPQVAEPDHIGVAAADGAVTLTGHTDRKSTRLNSSHVKISYAAVCLKKKRRRRSRARSLTCKRRIRRAWSRGGTD